MKKILLVLLLALPVQAEQWEITAYCSCKKCCGKSDGITASNKPAKWGVVANNWLKFGTKLRIEGFDNVFSVQDRGAKSEFGDKNNHKKRIDIWFPTHDQARKFGRQKLEVILEKEKK
jgi:3D (Asp-Asp-Asp) domain-containing protein